MKHRIEYLIGELKMTNAKFAEEIDVPKSIISHILTGRNKPSLEFITKILKRFNNINSDWLLFGKGNIYKSLNDSNDNTNKLQDTTLFDSPFDTKKQEIPEIKEEKQKTENKIVITKQIKKIIVYYTDNTFEEFNK